jgi:GTPase Era involved in 16S rRNA processing
MSQIPISRDRLAGDAMILGTQGARRQLKVIAAMTRETMREVLVRLVHQELKRVAPKVQL